MANVCLITNHTTIIRARIDVAVPRKRKGGGTALGAEKVSPFFGLRLPTNSQSVIHRLTGDFILKCMRLWSDISISILLR